MSTHEANPSADEQDITVVLQDGTSADPDTSRRPGAAARAWQAFAAWATTRPFVGGLLTVLAGVELFFSGQLDVGHIHLQFGIQGFQAMVIPVVMVLLGVLIWTMPVHRVFYGVIALVLAVYSIIGVNLGGFFIGAILGIVGGVVSVSWIPRAQREAAARDQAAARDGSTEGAEDEAAAPADDDYSLVPGFADARSAPPTLTLHSVETVETDAPSTGPRPFLGTPAETAGDAEPVHATGTDGSPDAAEPAGAAASTTDGDDTDLPSSDEPGNGGDARRRRRASRLTRVTGAAAVAVCAAAGVGVVDAVQAPSANAESISLPPILQWLVSGSSASSDEASTAPTGDPTATDDATSDPSGSASPSSSATGTDGSDDASTPSASDDATRATGTTSAKDSPSDTSSDTSSDTATGAPSGAPSGTASDAATDAASDEATPTSPLPAATTPAPQLAATSDMPVAPDLTSHLEASDMQLTWSYYQGNVKLKRADGSTVEVMKFTADKVVMDDFSLDVSTGDSHGLLTTSSKVTNKGHVVVYATKLSAKLLGIPLTFTPDSPPPSLIPLPSLTDPVIELVATTSDSSTWADAHQKGY